MLSASCGMFTRAVPWRDEPVRSEVNMAFTLERNLIALTSITIDGRPGRFLLGSAAPRTVVDPAFSATSGGHLLQIGAKETVRVTGPGLALGGVADAIIGADAWNRRAITIDYHVGLVSYQKEGIHPEYMTLYRFNAEPAINMLVDGRQLAAIVDTSLPDTLVLPAARHTRGNVHVRIDGTDFGEIDVQYADVAQARVGNRLLSRFLVTIDYGRRVVGLWRDPRIAESGGQALLPVSFTFSGQAGVPVLH